MGICKQNEQKPFVDREFAMLPQEGIHNAENKTDRKAHILAAQEPTDTEELEELKLTAKDSLQQTCGKKSIGNNKKG